MEKQAKLVIIGNGMVGHHLLQTLIDRGATERYAVTVIGGEPRPAYDRVHLSEVFAGREPADLALASRDQYRAAGIAAHFGDPVVRIDRTVRRVTTEGGQQFAYDRLVLATGSYPFVPPVKGSDRPGCYTYRTIDDLGEIRAAAATGRVGVVVGGGLLGLEAANALRNLGLEAHVVEFAPQLMAVQLDSDGGAQLRRHIEALGVNIHTGKNTRLIEAGSDHRLRMMFADDTQLETDLIVFSAGIRPHDQLARDAGLTLGERGGVVIDDRCRTSDPDILAIGECALWNGRIFGLVAPGYRMAEAAADTLLAGEGRFTGADMSTKLKLLGVDVGSIGDAHARTPGALVYQWLDQREGVYRKLVVDASGRRLLGAVLVGDCDSYDTLLQYALNSIQLPPQPMALIADTSESVPSLGPDALPATATICSCHNVSKGAIVAAIDSGGCSLAAIKGATRASTGCGGCSALLKSVVDCELAARGVEVNNHICEHFAFSRQELFHLIQVGDLHSFDQIIRRHGSGRGCDICKPAVASILASLDNAYILEPQHAGLQDSNDRALANLQKNGTYSVVPRIPGGEITPDKLIVLGEVARRFNLYTKITGGQRIDLFGAELHQLPLIWEALVQAGFETGHAYGKSLRTVKSCVGSTWCRYGVQDSVGMAIALENRYKGLRSPHKIKFAVSGCTRECAEAQSKDIGVIATENGWNLYICGNGGMRPRHADLFATDLDDAALVRTIDRVLMFYVRTADRLQRTSVWLESLEGGLDYLKRVILDDALQLGSELDGQMQRIVDSYQCEWKATIRDASRRALFRTYVNADGGDPDLRFDEERGQRIPARLVASEPARPPSSNAEIA